MSSTNLEKTVRRTIANTSIGTQLGEHGSKAITAPMDAAKLAKALRRLEIQAVHETDAILRDLVAQSSVVLKNENDKQKRMQAISTSEAEVVRLLTTFRLALTPTPKDWADEYFSGMIVRGLAYRNDGPKLADAKAEAYSRMLQKYPPDATKSVCAKLRADGWLPGADVMELEIRNKLAWRIDTLKALEEARILTAEEIQKSRERALAYKFIEIYKYLPMWDTGSERCAQTRQDGVIELTAALNAFETEAREDHDYKQEQKNARRWIDEPFLPYPKQTEEQKREDAIAAAKLRAEKRKQAFADLGVDFPKIEITQKEKSKARKDTVAAIAKRMIEKEGPAG